MLQFNEEVHALYVSAVNTNGEQGEDAQEQHHCCHCQRVAVQDVM
jgi:hypothetical protein